MIIDARWSGQHGIGRFASEVLPGLHATAPAAVEYIRDLRGARPASVRDPVLLRRRIIRSGQSLFVTPGYNAALTSSSYRQLIVIHDLIHLRIAAEGSRLKSVYYERIVKPAIRQADLVVTVSEFSRREIAAWTAMPTDRIVVATPGSSLSMSSLPPAADDEPVARYLLFVGNHKPHKRLGLLLEAMSLLPSQRLVCVGPIPPSMIAPALRDRVEVRTALSDDELARLYRHARCLVLPSSYEGFGLPALEAMAFGTPVVYSCDAVHEIVDGLGVRVSATATPGALAAAIEHADDLAGEPSRAARIRRAARFSWDHTRAQVAAAAAALG